MSDGGHKPTGLEDIFGIDNPELNEFMGELDIENFIRGDSNAPGSIETQTVGDMTSLLLYGGMAPTGATMNLENMTIDQNMLAKAFGGQNIDNAQIILNEKEEQKNENKGRENESSNIDKDINENDEALRKIMGDISEAKSKNNSNFEDNSGNRLTFEPTPPSTQNNSSTTATKLEKNRDTRSESLVSESKLRQLELTIESLQTENNVLKTELQKVNVVTAQYKQKFDELIKQHEVTVNEIDILTRWKNEILDVCEISLGIERPNFNAMALQNNLEKILSENEVIQNKLKQAINSNNENNGMRISGLGGNSLMESSSCNNSKIFNNKLIVSPANIGKKSVPNDDIFSNYDDEERVLSMDDLMIELDYQRRKSSKLQGEVDLLKKQLNRLQLVFKQNLIMIRKRYEQVTGWRLNLSNFDDFTAELTTPLRIAEHEDAATIESIGRLHIISDSNSPNGLKFVRATPENSLLYCTINELLKEDVNACLNGVNIPKTTANLLLKLNE